MSAGPRRKAHLLQLAFMIYGAVCAGAFGLEDMVSGPLAFLALRRGPKAASV
ncbi:MAG: hypothetical protein PHU21_13700 [Elusimicrobia bacterium]|jgi:hypothetical protein|nr:hypothetical protein [Elusimicrobiota bacterium]